MYAEELQDNTNEPEFNAFIKGKTVQHVIEFIEQGMQEFSTACTGKGFNEKNLNHKLVNHLNRSSLPYTFAKDISKPSSQREEDIGVYAKETALISDAFFVLEAKRLPTPKSSARDVREYVIGKNQDGGIERFKREHHGTGLNPCGMIGYIEENDFAHWLKIINDWIKDLAANNKDTSISWHDSEILQEAYPATKHSQRFSSKHLRKSGNFFLTHIWVKLN